MQGPIGAISNTASVAVERKGYVWGIALVAALGGLLFGYDWVVIGGAREFYEIYFHLTSANLVGWANSCALVGCLVGSLMAGSLADRLGRKPVLLVSAVLFAISSLLTGWASAFSSFILWRIVGGIAIGLSSNVSPLYIAELSPSYLRGRLVSLNQFAIVVGILLAQIVNWVLARPVPEHATPEVLLQSWNVQNGWRWMFSALVVPAVIFTFASLWIPESPRWLVNRRRFNEAQTTLERVGGKEYAKVELAGIECSSAMEQKTTSLAWRELMRPPVRRVVLVGMALAVLQQWTGINILFNYAAEVYRNAGYGANDIFLNIVITGTINLIFTLMSMLMIDKVGRRKLMIFGCIGIAASHFLCAFAYHARMGGIAILALTLSAIACYALTLAPVTWVLIAEIFPQRVRAQGISIAISSLWIASFALTYSFPILDRRLGTASVFAAYGIICMLGCALVATSVRETKGQSLEEIETSVLGR
ncbi:sugar porter family MFS transporter [Edaphobacter albus]|uniref:sugar porter family MFS transporter n=1 Tax=Edaphobacter sp. 4G125 TaxID=2763071 RepID=UPI0016471FEA|nr:sugar porter family MFS transporter [Edaphobacter sp. 4G125]QNI36042.1 sugar porter family MFS transporter [Edaphobacter sp. 4G125]